MRPCKIDASFSTFRNGCKSAAKRHHSFVAELTTLLEKIELDAYSEGDRINRLGDDTHIRKIRIGLPKENIRPRAGYRLIIQVIETAEGIIGRCLTVYYKPDKSTLSEKEIKKLSKSAHAVKDEPVDSN